MLAAQQSVAPISTGFHFGIVCTAAAYVYSEDRKGEHPATWRHSETRCKWTDMPGSAAWSKRARMPGSGWHSVGLTRGAPFSDLLYPVATRGRGAGAPRER